MSRFKNNAGGFYTRALFFETTLADKATVVYTLKEEDHLGYPSLYRLYMEADDPTEYSFAVQHLAGWSHWEVLCKAPWFKPYVTAWRKELEIRNRAKALRAIKAKAESEDKDAFQANKFLLTGRWKTEEKRRPGQPSKQEIKQAADDLARTDANLTDDLERLRAN